jgi:hypothetical protein
MRTRTKGVRLGPVTLIAAVSSKSHSTRAKRRKESGGLFRRRITAVPHAAARLGSLARQMDRVGMVVGAVMTGLELAREIRSAGSKEAPSSKHTTSRSDAQSSSPSPTGSKARSSSRERSSSSASRSTSKSRSQNGAATRRARPAATKRSGSGGTAKKAGSRNTTARKHVQASHG